MSDPRFPGRCGGVVTGDDTVESLTARGFTDQAAREALRFVEFLGAKKRGEFAGSFAAWCGWRGRHS